MLLFALSALPGCRSAQPAVDAPPRYALLPLRNLTVDPDLPGLLAERLRQLLEARGAEFVPPDELERILAANRIRYVDTMGSSGAHAIAEQTGATHLVLGTLIGYEPSDPPRIALSLRVIECAQGHRVQSTVVSLIGDDFEGLLGLGAIQDPDALAWEVVARAADMFDERGAPRPLHPDQRALARYRPVQPLFVWVDPAFTLEPGARVAVLPFANRSTMPEAGLLFADLLAHAWMQSMGVESVETGELLDALARQRARSIDSLDSTQLGEVARSVGARYLVLGSIEHLELEVPTENGDSFPDLEVWLRLVDAEQGRFVAGVAQRRRGDEYHVALGLGSERDAVRLALRTARELLATLSG